MTKELHLEWVDRRQNRFRFYDLSIEENLFGDKSLVIHWGRIGSPGGQRIHASGTPDEMRLKAMQLARRKLRKGYGASASDLARWRLSDLDQATKGEPLVVALGDLFQA